MTTIKSTQEEVGPDRTATGKVHFEVLDGLRGSAALLIVAFHIVGIPLGFDDNKNALHHAYLAVDFFFALSGFVVGYAYDDRWRRMSTLQFFKIRLIRLQPLVVLGSILGVFSYLFDPFAGPTQHAPAAALTLVFILSASVLPSPGLPHRVGDTHPLNGPAWSLFQEYIANIVYALVLRRLSTTILGVFGVIAAVVLAFHAWQLNILDSGWGWENLWMAPVRLAYPFITGLVLYRIKDRLPQIRLGFFPLTLVLIAAFMAPSLPAAGNWHLNGLYDALCVLLLFPAIIIAGAHSEAGRGAIHLCKFSGRISYPIYMTHYPFMYIYANYITHRKPPAQTEVAIAFALAAWVLLVAFIAMKFWDEPIREVLRRKFLQKQPRPTYL